MLQIFSREEFISTPLHDNFFITGFLRNFKIIPGMFKIFGHEVLWVAVLCQDKTEPLINYKKSELIKNYVINYFTDQFHVAYYPTDYSFAYLYAYL